MKKVIAAVLLGLLLAPSAALAHDDRDWRYERQPRAEIFDQKPDFSVSDTVEQLGGVLAGVLLEKVFPGSSASLGSVLGLPDSNDSYNEGYSEGYSRGVERGSRERYEQGRRRGYRDGYEDARRGRRF